MKFIEALKLKSKLLFLFILITVGLFSVGIMGTIYTNSMKKNLDSLYFGSLVPVVELNEILQIYHGDLGSAVYKVKNGDIPLNELNLQINNSLMKINKRWRSYSSHFKRDDEMGYVEYTAHEIEQTNRYFKAVLQAGSSGKDLHKISVQNLNKVLENIHSTIKKLINYEVEVAQYDRKHFLQTYSSILFQIGFVLFVVTIGVLFILYYVFKSIQNDHTKLEVATKKLKRVNKKLENVSYTDSLTSLHNRRYFNFIYDRELKRARRAKSYITFMMLDIDFFKQYNDCYGHIEGDLALQSVAKVLKESLKRPSDFVFRIGGEEFAVLLVDTDELNSARLANDICKAVEANQIEHRKSDISDYITVSIGVVCCIADEALDDEALLSRADKMLYNAKHSGRNCYIITTNLMGKDEEQEGVA